MSDKITLDDLETRLRDIGSGVQTTANEMKAPVLGGAGVAVALGMAAVYLLGRRRGRKEAPVLEIRRI
jgi:membrane protein DedA with SNARE-associated domain